MTIFRKLYPVAEIFAAIDPIIFSYFCEYNVIEYYNTKGFLPTTSSSNMRRKIIVHAARKGYSDVLETVMPTFYNTNSLTSIFRLACESGDYKTIKMLERKYGLHYENSSIGVEYFMICMRRCPKAVKSVIESKMQTDSGRQSLLTMAVMSEDSCNFFHNYKKKENDNRNALKIFIKAYEKMDDRPDFNDILKCVIRYDREDILKYLITKNNVVITKKEIDELTAFSVFNMSLKCESYLVSLSEKDKLYHTC